MMNGSKWRPISCLQKHCRATRTSAKWFCACNRLWYTCPQHGPIGHLAGSQERFKPAGTKRPAEQQIGPDPPPPPTARWQRNQEPIHTAGTIRPADLQKGPDAQPPPTVRGLSTQDPSRNGPRRAKRKSEYPTPFQGAAKRPNRRQEAVAAFDRIKQARLQERDHGTGM